MVTFGKRSDRGLSSEGYPSDPSSPPVGSVTLHPSGLPHGPQPGLAEKSLGVAETTELAVMCDTFRPLNLSTLARDLDDGKYALSWYEPPSDEPSLAGVTSHL